MDVKDTRTFIIFIPKLIIGVIDHLFVSIGGHLVH